MKDTAKMRSRKKQMRLHTSKPVHLMVILQARDMDKEQRNGKFPLTPEEIGLVLRALGFGFMAKPMEVKPGRGEFHENSTLCICADSEMDSGAAIISVRRDKGEVTNGQVGEEEQEWYDTEYTVNELDIQ